MVSICQYGHRLTDTADGVVNNCSRGMAIVPRSAAAAVWRDAFMMGNQLSSLLTRERSRYLDRQPDGAAGSATGDDDALLPDVMLPQTKHYTQVAAVHLAAAVKTWLETQRPIDGLHPLLTRGWRPTCRTSRT